MPKLGHMRQTCRAHLRGYLEALGRQVDCLCCKFWKILYKVYVSVDSPQVKFPMVFNFVSLVLFLVSQIVLHRSRPASSWNCSHNKQAKVWISWYEPEPLQEPASSAEVEEVEFQVQELHRDDAGEGLPPEALHWPAAQTSLREGPAHWETGNTRVQILRLSLNLKIMFKSSNLNLQIILGSRFICSFFNPATTGKDPA